MRCILVDIQSIQGKGHRNLPELLHFCSYSVSCLYEGELHWGAASAPEMSAWPFNKKRVRLWRLAPHVVVVRVPITSSLGHEIEQVPDGRIGVNAPVIVLINLCADSVAVIDRAVRRAREDAQARILCAVCVLHAKVAIEGVVVAGEQADVVPASLSREAAQFADLRLSHEREIRLSHYMELYRPASIGTHATPHSTFRVPGCKTQ